MNSQYFQTNLKSGVRYRTRVANREETALSTLRLWVQPPMPMGYLVLYGVRTQHSAAEERQELQTWRLFLTLLLHHRVQHEISVRRDGGLALSLSLTSEVTTSSTDRSRTHDTSSFPLRYYPPFHLKPLYNAMLLLRPVLPQTAQSRAAQGRELRGMMIPPRVGGFEKNDGFTFLHDWTSAVSSHAECGNAGGSRLPLPTSIGIIPSLLCSYHACPFSFSLKRRNLIV